MSQLNPFVATTTSLSSKVLQTDQWKFSLDLCSTSLTLRCGIADGEGGQCRVQPVDSVVEMLSEEDMALHGLTGQGM